MKKMFNFRTIKDEYNCTNTILDFVLLLYFVEPLFFYRLKQHNGKLKGGAKASRAGKPWTCACIVQGFKDQSEGISLVQNSIFHLILFSSLDLFFVKN